MKKIVILPFIMILFSSPIADDILNEGFEGGSLPSGWDVWEEATTYYTWYFNNSHPHTGTYNAQRYFDWYNVDSWLVTPTLDCTGYQNLAFSSWYTGYDPSFYTGTYFLAATTASPVPADFTQIFEYGAPPTSYTEKTADLSAYNEAPSLTLAIRYTGSYGHGVYIDDVKVTGDVIPGVKSSSLGAIKALYK